MTQLTDIESAITAQVTRLAYAMFRWMSLTDEWGDWGKEPIHTAFSRCVMGVDPVHHLAGEVVAEFSDHLEDKYRELGIDTLSLENLKQIVDEFKFQVDGVEYEPHKIGEVNQKLRSLGSEYLIQGGHYGDEIEFIVGTGRWEQVGQYQLAYIEKEVIRTPNTIMAMAASIAKKDIFIREESLKSIFQQKWVSIWDTAEQYAHFLMDPHYHISMQVKQKVIGLYQKAYGPDVSQSQPHFLADMTKTILSHEIGHGISQNHLLDKTYSVVGEASRVFGENAMTVLHELFADLAPEHDGNCGPLQQLCDIAKTDHDRAERMFWMYVSDTWFFDTPDEYMYLYSKLMGSILCSAVTDDGKVDFGRLKVSIYAPIQALFDQYCEQLMLHCGQLTVTLDDGDYAFEDAYNIVEKKVEKSTDDEDSLVAIYAQLFMALNKDNAVKQPIRTLLDAQEKDLIDQVMMLLSIEMSDPLAYLTHRYQTIFSE